MASFMPASRLSATIMRGVKEAIRLNTKVPGSLSEVHSSRRRMILRDGLCCNRRLVGVPFSFRGPYRRAFAKCNHSLARTVPYSDPPSAKDVDRLYDFIDRSRKLMVLTGAGISTESGIPDYRSPNGAYSSGFKPITHQQFVRSSQFRRRYWARSYAGWRKFIGSKPNTAHYALASLERVGRVNFMVTQNVDRLHHRAGSNPLELHGTVYTVICLDCNASISRELFQEQLQAANPKWAAEIEKLESGSTESDENLGVQRPDADVEIDKKFWEEEFDIPDCQDCGGVLKPDVVFFGDNVPKERADKAKKGARECDAFLILGSSVMTMSAFRLVSAAHEAGAPVAIVSIGDTRADDLAALKINARCGEILPRLLDVGSLAVPSIS